MAQPPPPIPGYVPFGHPSPDTPSAPPPPRRRWWQHPATVITALVLFPPGGIALAWLSRWGQGKRITATVLASLWFVTPLLADPPKDPKTDAAPRPAPSSTATASPATPSPSDATRSPEPAGTPTSVMPAVVGQRFAAAEGAVEDRTVQELAAASAYADVKLPADHANWTVCFQTPAVGEPLDPGKAAPNVHLVAPATRCPGRLHTTLHPKPTPTPAATKPSPHPKPTTTPSRKPTQRPTPSRDTSGNSSNGTVTPGAFCSPAGAVGVSKKGVVYTCKGPGQARWRR
ncbi:hypothetical protein [Streptomyces sp. NPDC048659]|uniref:hypothetical protein n=1 Tax=Streptomyces sp. NPDC048659 TaxID=3155489 RepID=UPI003424AD5A